MKVAILGHFCGGRRVCDEITRQGRILMQRQYTSILVDSEALEARWYCSIVNFQLYLALTLLFRLLWEFFAGKMIQSLIFCSLFSLYMRLLLHRIPTFSSPQIAIFNSSFFL
ncbi:PREDICTED: uncharacterized protein LOC105115916 isoform X2 [Populus euphratica]|uniref:Uncharacterized protein LOC105115916 isoform X2 n=1 Tax=Populus euphratica TaxID=75702 RepID=A0AAJ6XA35_POPEU|nr:PREDICTED: uncharacterized protein LOC105115916 isoform X2 [Populus euphratica]